VTTGHGQEDAPWARANQVGVFSCLHDACEHIAHKLKVG
jgi:hypothetical protein